MHLIPGDATTCQGGRNYDLEKDLCFLDFLIYLFIYLFFFAIPQQVCAVLKHCDRLDQHAVCLECRGYVHVILPRGNYIESVVISNLGSLVSCECFYSNNMTLSFVVADNSVTLGVESRGTKRQQNKCYSVRYTRPLTKFGELN